MTTDGARDGASGGHLLAIDFGSTNTVAVLRSPDGSRRVLLFDGAPLLPSAVYAAPHGDLLVGRDATLESRHDPARYEPYPKRRVDDGTVLLGARDVPVTDLIAAVLRRAAGEARRTAGTLPPAVLTHPVAWGAPRRALLVDAAHRAGLTVRALVPEPIAAAAYFAEVLAAPGSSRTSGSSLASGAPLAVFDLGGGTFDVAVVRRAGPGGELTVVGTGGLDDVGGLDLDAAILDHLGTQLSARAPAAWRRLVTPADDDARRDRDLLWQDVRAVKERLSRTTTATLHVPGLTGTTHLTREEFESLAAPLLDRAVTETAGVLAARDLTPNQLAGIFLVGGASRIPLAARLLHTRLGVAPTVLEQPETAVAEGALVADASAPPTPVPSPTSAPASPPPPSMPTSPPVTGVPPVPPVPPEPPESSGAPAPAPVPGGPAEEARRRWLLPAGLVAAGVVLVVALAVGIPLMLSGNDGNDGNRHRAGSGGSPTTSASGTPTAAASATPSGSPSGAASSPAAAGASCPSADQIRQAVGRDKEAAGMTITSVDRPYCVDGYAYVQVSVRDGYGTVYPYAGVERYADGTWTDLVLGGVICQGDPNPDWSAGVPNAIMVKAGCR